MELLAQSAILGVIGSVGATISILIYNLIRMWLA